MKNFLYVANWKMFFSFSQAQQWLTNNQETLTSLKSHKIILCPSFDILAYTASQAKYLNVMIGAQDCSAHKSGAYTGQISAQSLAEIGCTYCIVGHREQRVHLTNTLIKKKLEQLANHSIIPILCLGEPSEKQLAPAQHYVIQFPTKELIIAYEPPEAIGSGISAPKETIIHAITDIKSHMQKTTNLKLVYGGSVAPENSNSLKSIESLDGFLIGSASTDINKFKAIITA